VDAYLNGGWKTVLAGTTGAGGRGVFVLDATHPADFTANDVLWDYDGASAGDNDLGDTLGEATIARFSNGDWDWVVLFGNGYNSPNQHAVLYIYDLTAAKLVKIDTGAGSTGASNGLSSPVPVDLDGDRITDVIYAGDLQGNLWKFDVSKWNSSNAKSVTKSVLFQAKEASGRIQPITVKPDVGRNKNGNVTVYFGTGKYFETTDKTIPANPVVQSFYGIVDTGKTVGRSDLLKQSVLDTVNVPTADGGSEDVRVTSHNRFPIPNSKQGWHLDLPIGGERVVSDPRLHFGRIIFTTTIPIDDPCQAGGQSWLMELDANTGARLDGTPFDVNNDGKFDKQDLVTILIDGKRVTVPVSGKKSTQGIIKTPGIISAGEREFKYASGSTGKLETTLETNPNDKGRLSWKQLQ
jgi:type IV pilus assembly protein PilY1